MIGGSKKFTTKEMFEFCISRYATQIKIFFGGVYLSFVDLFNILCDTTVFSVTIIGIMGLYLNRKFLF